MKKLILFIILSSLMTSCASAETNVKAKDVLTTASAFTKNLNGTDVNVQAALQTIDQFTFTGGTWGSITGTLSNQTDLQTALNAKQVNLSLLPGTYINGDICTYSSSGTLLNCNTALGSGTVTSVAMTGDGVIYNTSVTGSPVSSSGTLIPVLSNQSANKVLAGPASGGGAQPTFRSIVTADIPTLNQNTTGTAGNVTGTVAIANGGSGQTTQQLAINALTGSQVSGTYLRSNGTNASLSAIQAGDVPTLNQNTTGSAGSLSGTQTQNTFYAAPNGSSGTASFRAIVSADVPTLNQNTSGNAATVTTNANLSGPIASVGNTTSVTSQTGTGTTFVMKVAPILTANVGINTLTPGQALDVQGTVRALNFVGSGAGLTGLTSGTVTSVGLSSPSSTLTIGSTPVTSTGTITGDINLAHSNTWTGQQVFNSQNVGVGSSTPGASLDVAGTIRTTNFTLTTLTPSRPVITNGSNNVSSGFYAGSSGVFATANGTLTPGDCVKVDSGNNFVDSGSPCGGTGAGGSNTQIQVNSTGSFTGYTGFVYTGTNMGIGSITPGQRLDVQGTVRTVGFNLSTTPSNGYVLTSDANGNGTWQAGAASSNWTLNGTNIYNNNAGNVGVGSTVPGQKLDVQGTVRDLGESVTGNVGISNGVITLQGNTSPAFITGVNLGIGSTNPGQTLDVAGTVRTVNFILSTSPTNGYVLTSNGTGTGTWQAPVTGTGTVTSSPNHSIATYSGTGTTVAGSSSFFYDGANVGIGTSSPTGDALTLNNTGGGMLALMNNNGETMEVTSVGSAAAVDRLGIFNFLGVTNLGDNWLQYRFAGAGNKWYFGDDGSSKAFFQTTHGMRFWASASANSTSDSPQLVITTDSTTVQFPNQKSNSGTRYACFDTSGNLVSQTTACSGT